ncbi:MAG TPA: hypothetical protein VL500_03910 [Candidatus Eisenbacteria bacterium]|nr:hypothetical protein [Candidatus Eisenbacteria bacterium]
MRTWLFSLAVIFAAAAPASAHLAGGTDVVKDGYILDLGFDPAPPIAGQLTTFAINMADEKSDRPLEPDAVWVRISQGEAIAFAGTLRPDHGNATFQAVMPEAGPYEVTARYSYRNSTIEGEFRFDAVRPQPEEKVASAPPPSAKDDRDGALRVLAAVAIAFAAYLVGRRQGAAETRPSKDRLP